MGCESIETSVCTTRLLWTRALFQMDIRRLPGRIIAGPPENPDRCEPGGKEKWCTNCEADDVRLFGIRDGEKWKIVTLDPGKWWEIEMEGGRTFMDT